MAFREVSKSQQSFHCTTVNNEFTFQFYKVFKQQAKNKLRLRVVQMADFSTAVTAQPHIYFAQNISNANAIYSGESSGGLSGVVSNELCLGICPRNYYDIATNTDTSGVTTFSPIEIYLDELTTSPFTIKYRHVGTTAYGTQDVGFFIVFEITEIEFHF